MGADPSINWGDVSTGYDAGVDASEQAIKSAETNKQYWENQDVLWASMFGNQEANVANYYDSLTADGATSELNQQTTASITVARDRTLQQLQDRGLSNSGMVAQVLANSNSNEAIMLASNAYTANKDVWQQKVAFMQGIALPQKQRNQQGISSAQGQISNAYGAKSSAEFTRANANMQVTQFNEQHSNDQMNSILGGVSTIAGAALGGGYNSPSQFTNNSTSNAATAGANIVPNFDYEKDR